MLDVLVDFDSGKKAWVFRPHSSAPELTLEKVHYSKCYAEGSKEALAAEVFQRLKDSGDSLQERRPMDAERLWESELTLMKLEVMLKKGMEEMACRKATLDAKIRLQEQELTKLDQEKQEVDYLQQELNKWKANLDNKASILDDLEAKQVKQKNLQAKRDAVRRRNRQLDHEILEMEAQLRSKQEAVLQQRKRRDPVNMLWDALQTASSCQASKAPKELLRDPEDILHLKNAPLSPEAFAKDVVERLDQRASMLKPELLVRGLVALEAVLENGSCKFCSCVVDANDCVCRKLLGKMYMYACRLAQQECDRKFHTCTGMAALKVAAFTRNLLFQWSSKTESGFMQVFGELEEEMALEDSESLELGIHEKFLTDSYRMEEEDAGSSLRLLFLPQDAMPLELAVHVRRAQAVDHKVRMLNCKRNLVSDPMPAAAPSHVSRVIPSAAGSVLSRAHRGV